jgi:hypothetical protein
MEQAEESVDETGSSVIRRKNRTLLTDKSTRPTYEHRAGGT